MNRSYLLIFSVAAPLMLILSNGCGGGPTAPTRVPDSALQDIVVELVPNTGAPQDVSVVAVTVANPSQETRRQVRVNLVVPNGINSFFGGATGGGCFNLLDNCIPGAVLGWVVDQLEAGDRRTFIAPALVRNDESATGMSKTLPFAASMNWNGGGGPTSLDRLEVSYMGKELPAISVRKHVAVTGKGLRVEVQSSKSSVGNDSEFVVSFTVVNESARAIPDATLRFVVPQKVTAFSGGKVEGSCYNFLNNCFPGLILTWNLGAMSPQGRRSFEVPLRTLPNASEVKGAKQITLCGAASGEIGSGGFACVSVSLS